MIRSSRPSADPRIRSAHGVTKDGHPVSYNRAPAADLAPWIARIYVAEIDAPPDLTMCCGLFSDTGILRVQLSGEWTVETPQRTETFGRSAMFFGPQSRLLPVSIKGPFTTLGIVLRPCACTVLLRRPLSGLVDRVVPSDDIWLTEQALTDCLEPGAGAETWLTAIEALLRQRILETGSATPDPVTARFEEIALRDPAMSIAQAAREIGVDRRQLERLVRRDFGLPPKQVLKRARALDMASHLLGVADGEEAEALELRYYDESHLIHEFVELFRMSPRQFGSRPQPLLTLTLEARQARRLELIDRIVPGEPRPWQ